MGKFGTLPSMPTVRKNVRCVEDLKNTDEKKCGTTISLQNTSSELFDKLFNLTRFVYLEKIVLRDTFHDADHLTQLFCTLGKNQRIRKELELDVRNNSFDENSADELNKLISRNLFKRLELPPISDPHCCEDVLREIEICGGKLEILNIGGSVLTEMSINCLENLIVKRIIEDQLLLRNCFGWRQALTMVDRDRLEKAEQSTRRMWKKSLNIYWFNIVEHADMISEDSEENMVVEASYKHKVRFMGKAKRLPNVAQFVAKENYRHMYDSVWEKIKPKKTSHKKAPKVKKSANKLSNENEEPQIYDNNKSKTKKNKNQPDFVYFNRPTSPVQADAMPNKSSTPEKSFPGQSPATKKTRKHTRSNSDDINASIHTQADILSTLLRQSPTSSSPNNRPHDQEEIGQGTGQSERRQEFDTLHLFTESPKTSRTNVTSQDGEEHEFPPCHYPSVINLNMHHSSIQDLRLVGLQSSRRSESEKRNRKMKEGRQPPDNLLTRNGADPDKNWRKLEETEKQSRDARESRRQPVENSLTRKNKCLSLYDNDIDVDKSLQKLGEAEKQSCDARARQSAESSETIKNTCQSHYHKDTDLKQSLQKLKDTEKQSRDAKVNNSPKQKATASQVGDYTISVEKVQANKPSETTRLDEQRDSKNRCCKSEGLDDQEKSKLGMQNLDDWQKRRQAKQINNYDLDDTAKTKLQIPRCLSEKNLSTPARTSKKSHGIGARWENNMARKRLSQNY